jgi:hypothetical protein
MERASIGRAIGYRVLACALMLFGVVDLLAIGLPFLVLGLTLLPVGRFRHQPRVFRPALAAGLGAGIAAALVMRSITRGRVSA